MYKYQRSQLKSIVAPSEVIEENGQSKAQRDLKNSAEGQKVEGFTKKTFLSWCVSLFQASDLISEILKWCNIMIMLSNAYMTK